MSGATQEGPAPPRRRRGRDAAVALLCLVVWIAAMLVLAPLGGTDPVRNGLAGLGMIGLFAFAWGVAEWLVHARGMLAPGTMLGLLGPICLGYALAFLNRFLGVLPQGQWITLICAGAAAGMTLFMFRLRLAVLASPIVTFSVVALFFAVQGTSPDRLREIEGLSPRGILAALIDEPLNMAVIGAAAVALLVFARWLDLHAQEFGMRSAKPLHIVGAGVTALVAGRLAGALPWPFDLATLAVLLAAAMAWGLRVDRLAVVATAFFALAGPLIVALAPADAEMGALDWIAAHMAVLGAGFFFWPLLRKRTVAAGYTKQPRHIKWNWPDRVIWPYRPPPDHR